MCLTRPMDFDVNPRHWVYNCFLVIPPLLLTTAGRAGPGTPRLVWSQYCPSGFSEPGREAQHGAGERVPAGGSRVEGGQVRGGRRGAAQAWASQVELLAPGGDPQLCPRCCGSQAATTFTVTVAGGTIHSSFLVFHYFIYVSPRSAAVQSLITLVWVWTTLPPELIVCTSFISYESAAVLKIFFLIHSLFLAVATLSGKNNFETIGWRPNFDFNFARRCKRRWAGRKGKNI